MPSIQSDSDSVGGASITQAIGNLARAATTRHRHTATLSSSSSGALPLPQTPQHTNAPQHGRNRTAGDISTSMPSHSPSMSHLDTRRLSTASTGSASGVQDGPVSSLTIEFDGGTHVIVRPNRVVRGKVILTAVERLYVSKIRIKFRAEEIAMVKIDEGGTDQKYSERLHQILTTFFETDFKLWGNDSTAYSQAAWDELEPGIYEFPFALKFPNVNYPPSMEEPKGFSIRYSWTAQIDGPALQSGLKSREYLTPYRPIIVATPDREWEYRKTLKDKKQTIAEVKANLLKQSYCPDEPFLMHLKIALTNPDSRITNVHFKFRKHHEGKMLVQRGTAFKEHIRNVIQGQVPINSSADSQFEQDISFDVPTRLVSPSFVSNHTRVHYDITFLVTVEHGGIFKSVNVIDFSIPITISNLPYNQLLRIPGLTSIASYKNSKELPQFFDANLEEPPEQSALPSELMGSLQAALMTSTPRDDPPNYFSIPTSNLELRKERKERSVYLTRTGRIQAFDLLEATVIPGLFDESW